MDQNLWEHAEKIRLRGKGHVRETEDDAPVVAVPVVQRAEVSDMMAQNEISATIPDWTRERCRRFWDPSRQLLRSIRRYQNWKSRGPLLRWLRRYWVLHHRFWSVVTGADIPIDCKI